jgi:serine/threonine-protein kinase
MSKINGEKDENTLQRARRELEEAGDAAEPAAEPADEDAGRAAYDALWDSVDRIKAEVRPAMKAGGHDGSDAEPEAGDDAGGAAPLSSLARAPGSGRQARLDPEKLRELAHRAAPITQEIAKNQVAAAKPLPRVGDPAGSIADALAQEGGGLSNAELDAQTAMKPNPLGLQMDAEAGEGARVVRDEQAGGGDAATVTLDRPASPAQERGPVRPDDMGGGVIAGRYQDQGVIARGGFGAIHQVVDDALSRRVAMKVLEAGRSSREKDVLRFFEEAQITGQLDHPNIVPVHELGVDDHGRHFFTMKMVRGKTLKEILKATDFEQRSPLELERALQIMLKVCDALSFAHSKGVVHRDLKPDNIMVGTHGQVYLMDWGIAQLDSAERPSQESGEEAVVVKDNADGAREVTGTIIGTPAFMAPEQAMGQIHDIDHRTDIFALGGLLYQILTDEPPYTGADAIAKVNKAQKCRVVPPQERAPGWNLPPGLCAIAMKALSKKKSRRHKNVAEFKEEIETFLRGGFWFAEVSFKKGEVIIHEGDKARSAFIITAGSCEAYKTDGDEEMVLREMGPGDVFGETAILTGKVRSASVRALSRVRAMVVTREALEAELSGDSWMGSLVKVLAARFREQDQTLVEAVRTVQAQEIVIAGLQAFAAHGEKEHPLGSFLKPLRRAFDRSESEIIAALEELGPFEVDKTSKTIRLA